MISITGRVAYPPAPTPRRDAARDFREAWDASLRRDSKAIVPMTNGHTVPLVQRESRSTVRPRSIIAAQRPSWKGGVARNPYNRVLQLWDDQGIRDIAVIAAAVDKSEEVVRSILKSQDLL